MIRSLSILSNMSSPYSLTFDLCKVNDLFHRFDLAVGFGYMLSGDLSLALPGLSYGFGSGGGEISVLS